MTDNTAGFSKEFIANIFPAPPDWKTKTCSDCLFMVGDECRRGPISFRSVPKRTEMDQPTRFGYPAVLNEHFGTYHPACAEFKLAAALQFNVLAAPVVSDKVA